jgi:preprotein translocase SecF subunit
MIRVFQHANYDFLGVRRYAYAITAALALVGLLALAVRGVNESIEFTGGTLVHVRTTDPAIAIGDLRSALLDYGIGGAELSTFGTSSDFVIRAPLATRTAVTDAAAQEAARRVDSALTARLGAGTYATERVEAIHPKVGRELRTKALIAVVLSFGVTLIYLAVRFEWRFALATIAATAHDIVLTIAFIALLHLEISLVIIAAVLTIIGYSMNDTVVVFDRVRENLHKYKRQQFLALLNRSVNETLPRTVLTGGTTIVALIALLVFGGTVIRPFAMVMLFGIVLGTFSSIFIASPVLLMIERRWPGEDVRGTKTLEPTRAQPVPAPAD